MAVNHDKFSEPSQRDGHVSALVDGKVFVWGGDTGRTEDADHCYHFDTLTESWSQSDCIGPTPPGFVLAACASAGHHLYVYGGRDKEKRHYSSLHQLDLRTNTWRMISSDGPRRKRACGLVHVTGDLSSYLLLVGGRDEGYNDTDEIHMFDLNEGEKEGAMCYGYIWGLVHVMKCELKCIIVRP